MSDNSTKPLTAVPLQNLVRLETFVEGTTAIGHYQGREVIRREHPNYEYATIDALKWAHAGVYLTNRVLNQPTVRITPDTIKQTD